MNYRESVKDCIEFSWEFLTHNLPSFEVVENDLTLFQSDINIFELKGLRTITQIDYIKSTSKQYGAWNSPSSISALDFSLLLKKSIELLNEMSKSIIDNNPNKYQDKRIEINKLQGGFIIKKALLPLWSSVDEWRDKIAT